MKHNNDSGSTITSQMSPVTETRRIGGDTEHKEPPSKYTEYYRAREDLTGKTHINHSTDFFLKKNVNYVEDQWIGKYKLTKTLGKGSSAKVVQALDTETNETVAIKIIERNTKKTSDIRIFREILLCSLFNHPHIVKLLDFFHTDKYFFLIFENVDGCQLYDVVLKSGHLSEEAARKYFRQIVSAVDYIHRNAVVHRDLKIENIMVDKNDDIKLIDFGLSNFYDNDDLLNTFCGSLYFAAPELLMGQRYVGPEIDVWSLGVVLYVMICGKVPFDDESIHALQNKIKQCKFTFHRAVSEEAYDLISKMILSSDGRINLDLVKRSEWLNSGYENLVNNFMIQRSPLLELNDNLMRSLSAASLFQFPSLEEELSKYLDLCRQGHGGLEQIYLSRKPAVSLYYLMKEKFTDLHYKSIPIMTNDTMDIRRIEINHQSHPAILHNFVRLLTAETNDNLYNHFFSRSHFTVEIYDERSSEENTGRNDSVPDNNNYPKVRGSIVKGFFRGLKIKNTNQDFVKSEIMKIFQDVGIVYEANEKSYFCSYVHNNTECYFKMTLYYNFIVSEHYVVMNCLNKKKEAFKAAYETIKDKIAQIE